MGMYNKWTTDHLTCTCTVHVQSYVHQLNYYGPPTMHAPAINAWSGGFGLIGHNYIGTYNEYVKRIYVICL